MPAIQKTLDRVRHGLVWAAIGAFAGIYLFHASGGLAQPPTSSPEAPKSPASESNRPKTDLGLIERVRLLEAKVADIDRARSVDAKRLSDLEASKVQSEVLEIRIQSSKHRDDEFLRLTDKEVSKLLTDKEGSNSSPKTFGRKVIAVWIIPSGDVYRYTRQAEFDVLRADIVDGNKVSVTVKGTPADIAAESKVLLARVHVLFLPSK